MEFKYTARDSTDEYLRLLNEWNEGTYGKHDIRDFPQNRKKDLVLILRPDALYIPKPGRYVDQFVFYDYCKENESVDFLKNTVAEVSGVSDFIYYATWDNDLKLECEDEKTRYLNVTGAGDSFIFVPHLERFKDFKKLIPFIPDIPESDSDRITKTLKEHLEL